MKSKMRSIAEKAKRASRELMRACSNDKSEALRSAADMIRKRGKAILAASRAEVADARRAKLPAATLDRLALDSKRIEAMARAVEEVASLSDPVGEVTSTWTRPNGLTVKRVRIPLGVVLMIYEARPNVTADAAALCVKSGNAVILKAGSEALRSSLAISEAFAAGLKRAGLPETSAQVVPTANRAATLELLSMDDLIDLCIPRGGPGLIRAVAAQSRVPVVKHDQGVCHLFLDESAPVPMSVEIAVNAKAQRPGVCNALECLLVDRAAAQRLLPAVGRALVDAEVELRADSTALAILKRSKVRAKIASDDDFGREFLDRILAVRVVNGLEGALAHIERYGSMHTEAIVTRDLENARRFEREVVASAVVVNASTRFNDGGELGLGAEVGISTSKLHAFGPMGLAELTAQKFVVEGDGQVRT